MAEIQFEGESQAVGYQSVEQKPLFIRLVLATGIVSTDQQAQYVLLGIGILGILFTLFMLFSGSSTRPQPVPSITGEIIVTTPQ